jgi:hypothetical protein
MKATDFHPSQYGPASGTISAIFICNNNQLAGITQKVSSAPEGAIAPSLPRADTCKPVR